MRFEAQKKIFASWLLLVLFLSHIAFLVPREAHATVPTWDVGLSGPIPLTIGVSTGILPPYVGYHYDKEFGVNNLSLGSIWELIGVGASAGGGTGGGAGFTIPSFDAIAWVFAKVAITIIKQQLIDWIRSGFEGRPLFLQDPEKFFLEFADQATGVFIEDLGVQIAGDPDFFCSNFLPEFVLDLGLYGRRDYFDRARCTITQVVDNIEDYYEDFSNGRWNAFVQTQNRNNNYLDFYIMTLEENAYRRFRAESVFRTGTIGGQGFIPRMDCVEANAAGCRKYRIKTPAKTIADRITHSVGLDFGELLSADEISEIVAAFINLAIQKALESLLDG